MKRVLLYGCGENARKYCDRIENEGYEIVAFIDKAQKGNYKGILIDDIENVPNYSFDEIIITLSDIDECMKIRTSLIEKKVIDDEKIRILCLDSDFIEVFRDQRSEFIKDFAMYVHENEMAGVCAEAGVFRGDSAKFINKYFYDKQLYLFDSFEGFADNDLQYDSENINDFNGAFFNHETFLNTSIDLVMAKMPFPQKVIIKKGFFPKTAIDVEEKFCFVNLDMDLYMPMYDGLEFFYPRMTSGGVILLHDYFHRGLEGVKKAVCDFEEMHSVKLKKVTIGDHISIAIIV